MKELIKAYENNHIPYTSDQIAARRLEEDTRKFSTKKILAFGGAILAAATFYVGKNILDTGHPQTVTEKVRPHDSSWSVVRRAESDAGINPDSRDMRPIVDEVTARYGTTLYPGQEISVTLSK